MKNKEGYFDFVTSENYKTQLDVWYRAYNITREKSELFYDFCRSVYEMVNKTYLGSDVIYSEFDQKKHFEWCWAQVVLNFEKEKINFNINGSHFEYLWSFFYEAYYLTDIDGDKIKIDEYFKKLFDFNFRKTRSELDILTEMYKILEINLKK